MRALLYSRQSLKKYILANNKITLSEAAFNSQFNKAIKSGVEKGEFTQPKGKLLQCYPRHSRLSGDLGRNGLRIFVYVCVLTRRRSLGSSETREEGCGQARSQGRRVGQCVLRVIPLIGAENRDVQDSCLFFFQEACREESNKGI